VFGQMGRLSHFEYGICKLYCVVKFSVCH